MSSTDLSIHSDPRPAGQPRWAGAPGEPLYPTFADAARTARITEAVLRSAATRTWMEVH